MASPIETLILKLLEDELTKHDSNPKIDQILSAIGSIEAGISAISIAVEAQAGDIAAQKLAIQSIQIFLGAPDATISPEDQAALDQLRQQTTDLQRQAEGISTQPPQ